MLLRISFRVDVDEEGVKTGDWLASLEELAEFGDAVPSFPSFLFLEDLGSLPLDSYNGEVD